MIDQDLETMAVDADVPVGQTAVAHRTLGQDVWRQFRRHKGGLIGLALLIVITFAVYLGPFIYRADPFLINVSNTNMGPMAGHPLGTDNLGRDVLARVLVGGRISLAVGFAAMVFGLILGAAAGVLSGYFKRLDGPIMRFTDLFLALPILPLLLIVIMLFREPLKQTFGPSLGIFILVVFIIGATSWMITARVVRSEILVVKEKEFVLAAQSIGTRKRNIIRRHLLPNVMSPIMVSAALGVAAAIVTESALSFLGLGFPSDFPTWGRLLFDAKDYLQLTPWRVIAPGLLISLSVLSVNFIGDAIRDALDPKLRSR